MLWMLPNQVRCRYYWNYHRFHYCHSLRLVFLPFLERVHSLVVRTYLLVPSLPNLGRISIRYFMVHHGYQNYQNYALHIIDPCFDLSFPPCLMEFDLLCIHLQEGQVLRWNGRHSIQRIHSTKQEKLHLHNARRNRFHVSHVRIFPLRHRCLL